MSHVGQAVLDRLIGIFQDDPGLAELDFIPGDPDDTDPATLLLHVPSDHVLGITFPAISVLYAAATAALKAATAASPPAPADVDACTRAVLVINAGHGPAWTARKQLVLDGGLAAVADLAFVAFVQSRHKKMGEAWAHRRWLTERVVAANAPGTDGLAAVLRRELAVCTDVATKYRRNYYAWTHRAWVASHLPDRQLVAEVHNNVAWVRRHVSDHSALHYREVLLRRCFTAFGGGGSGAGAAVGRRSAALEVGMLAHELALVSHLSHTHAGHEALWCYRRCVAAALVDSWRHAGHATPLSTWLASDGAALAPAFTAGGGEAVSPFSQPADAVVALLGEAQRALGVASALPLAAFHATGASEPKSGVEAADDPAATAAAATWHDAYVGSAVAAPAPGCRVSGPEDVFAVDWLFAHGMTSSPTDRRLATLYLWWVAGRLLGGTSSPAPTTVAAVLGRKRAELAAAVGGVVATYGGRMPST